MNKLNIELKKVIFDYKATTKDTFGYLDLILTYVEQGTNFVNQYGDIQENAYGSMESIFGKFSDIIKKKENTALFESFLNSYLSRKGHPFLLGSRTVRDSFLSHGSSVI